MKNRNFKRMVALTIAATMTLTMVGCTGKKVVKEPGRQKTVVETEKHKLTEEDLPDVLTGLSDHYILQNAQNIDYLYGVQYDESIIKDIKVDSDRVKTADLGKYQVTYSVKVDTVALKEYQDKKTDAAKEANVNAATTEQTDENTNTAADTISNTDIAGINNNQVAESTNPDTAQKEDKVKADTKKDVAKESTVKSDDKKDDTNKTEEVEIKKDMEVIDESTAQDKANNGDLVWKDNNETVPKSDGTTVEEPTVTPPASTGTTGAATGGNSGNTGNAGNTGNTGNTAASGSTASSGSSNKGNTGSSGNKGGQASTPSQPSQPSKPAEPAKPVHTHTWTTVAEKGHYETQVVKAAYDEDVYGTKVVCGCGAQFDNDNQWEQHSIDGCPYGYSVKNVKVGMKHHDAVTKQVWVVDSKAYTYCTGCGVRQ